MRPPVERPSDHVNLIVRSVVVDPSFSKSIGASGTSFMRALLPSGEKAELPYEFYAIILAYIPSFSSREYGELVRVLN
jgi:hypothetical protein